MLRLRCLRTLLACSCLQRSVALALKLDLSAHVSTREDGFALSIGLAACVGGDKHVHFVSQVLKHKDLFYQSNGKQSA
eukprot:778117-Pelagomonas_calceolata.AAC.3